MAGTYSDTLVFRAARRARHHVAELLHVAAVYLGIAVLVTIVLGFTVPSLRDQSHQMYAALQVSLRPAAMDELAYGQSAASMRRDSMLSAPPLQAAAQPLDEPSATFAEALQAADSFGIPGVSKAQAQALRSYIARKYKIAPSVAGVLIQTVFEVAREKKLDPQLVLAVIAIESRYNPFAESHVGAQGLMQVMTKVHRDKFEDFSTGTAAAINPIANIRVGSQILHDCIKRRKSVTGGLACYVGATGPGDGGYGSKVLAERRRIALASGIPIGN